MKTRNEVGGIYKRIDSAEQISDAELIKELTGSLAGAIMFAGFIVMLVLFV